MINRVRSLAITTAAVVGLGIPGLDEATEEAEADDVDDDDVQHESENEGENDLDEDHED